MDGERLSELRKDRRVTQQQLAAALSVSSNTISAYERGINEPNDKMKIRLAKYFNVSVDYLLGLTDEPVPLNTRSYLLFFGDLPAEAKGELETFVEYIAQKYKVKRRVTVIGNKPSGE